MGLFRKDRDRQQTSAKEEWVTNIRPIPLESVAFQGARPIEVLQELPHSDSGDLDPAIWAAIEAASHSQPGSEVQLRSFASQGGATGWVGKLELGTLLMDEEGERLAEAIGLFSACIDAPFRDVVANASWNLSEILWVNAREDWFGYATLSAQLGNPLALVNLAERAAIADLDVADEWLGNARALVPRTNAIRTRAEKLAIERFAGEKTPDIGAWFQSAIDQWAIEPWAQHIDFYMNDGLVYNVEGGNASIATRYFPQCPESCYFDEVPRDCGACGRNSTNFLYCLAGNGDGTYCSLQLFRNDENVGVITLFQDALEDLSTWTTETDQGSLNGGVAGPGELLGALFSGCAPLLLGDIATDGDVILSDSSRVQGDGDFSVVRVVKPGTYAIVCWLAAPGERADVCRPLALGAIPKVLAQSLLAPGVHTDHSQRDEIIRTTWGRKDLLVQSHMSDVRLSVVSNNMQAESDPDLALSWALQFAESNDEGFYGIVRAGELSEARMRELLSLRGVPDPKFPWR